ncbi:unnamed protein product [Adineta steineri]|uniref:Tripeptidyl peptidase II second Ig-like domain-containing protein n=1 Tax=Adineta steineri TaxID=433720 RepID=A0A818T470_9BILA|nr:unnamed protein product [Adineta steineri]
MKLKASEIQVKCLYLHELFYDNEYECTLWICFDTNKQYLGAGDVLNDYSLKLEKGDFIIRMSIRHNKYDLLKRLLKHNGGTGLSLHIKHNVKKLPTPNFYHLLSALHTQKKQIPASSIKLQWRHQVPIYMTTVPENKFVQFYFIFRFPKEINTIYRYFTELRSTSSSNTVTDTNKKQVNSPVITTEEGIINNSSQKDQQYQEALRDLKISWISYDMEKRRNWFIDIYISLGMLLCDLSNINDETSTYLTNIVKILQKYIHINDRKLTNLYYKYNLMKKSYGCV